MVFDAYNRKRKNFAGKFFYIFIAVGIVAASFGIAKGISNKNLSSHSESNSSDASVTAKDSEKETESATSDKKVNMTVTGVPDDRTTSKEPDTSSDSLPYSGSFALPMGSDIIKDYSAGELVKNKTTDDWRTHDGLDFGGSEGNKVSAIQKGKVIAVYDDSFKGTVVEIDHSNGIIAYYCGLKSGSTVSVGTIVGKHDEIGKLGKVPIEEKETEHLHFEIRINDKLADPLEVMNLMGEEE